jgi:peptidyl-prolyl cis-trans isomerase B (cyclophilin B)
VSSSNRRERELARAKRERQLSRAASKQKQTNLIIVVAGAIVLGALAWILFGNNDAAEIAAPTESPTPSVAASLLDNCSEAPAPNPEPKQFAAPADMALTGNQLWTLTTNCGDIEVELFNDLAPITVNSFAFLTAEGYMDGILCHRITTAGLYVLQCGDPTATGTGGPGYSIPEENLPEMVENNYPAGTIAMARTATPGSGGSQFFIVYEDTTLGADYTIFGKITKGLDIVQNVAALGDVNASGDGAPLQPIGILNAEMEMLG